MLLAVASSVRAGIPTPDLLSTDPAEPRAHQQFDLVYTLESCGDIFAADTPSNRTVEVVGNAIRVTALYASQLCLGGQPYAPSYRWRIGPLNSGIYQVELRGYNEQGGPANSFPIASGEVTIAPSIPVPTPAVIPASGTSWLLGMIVLIAVAAASRIRRT